METHFSLAVGKGLASHTLSEVQQLQGVLETTFWVPAEWGHPGCWMAPLETVCILQPPHTSSLPRQPGAHVPLLAPFKLGRALDQYPEKLLCDLG